MTRCQSWSSWLYNLVSNLQDIYNLHYYVDRVCQRYLHSSIYLISKLYHFIKYFMILPGFYLISGHFILFLIWIYDLGRPFLFRKDRAAFLLANQDCWGTAWLTAIAYPLETFKCSMNVNKHLKRHS